MVDNHDRSCKRRRVLHNDNNNNNNNSNLSLQGVLPEEVFTDEILIRLPVKQLARMRCVSKTLDAYLSQPRFVKSHLARNLIRNNNKDNEVLLVVSPNAATGSKVQVTAHPSRSPDIQLTDLIKLPLDFPCHMFEWRVLGSIHGLVVFKCGPGYECFDLYLWNPSLSVVMRLPKFTTHHEDDPNNSNSLLFQFGFDPKSNDYKVVKLCVPDTPRRMMRQVEVYSMRRGTWEFISESCCFPSKVFQAIECDNHAIAGAHDGHVYWLYCTDHGTPAILAFDLGDEAFHEISLPDSICRSRDDHMMLGFFDGKLCVTSYRYDHIGVKLETWVMNNEQSSWVKHSVLPRRFTLNTNPMGFTLNNEFLIGDINPLGGAFDPLVLYDPETTEYKYFKGCCVDDATRIVQYVDSLVWITPAKKLGNTSCAASGLG